MDTTETKPAWTPIPGWSGYFATKTGRIASASGWRGHSFRELVQEPNTDGYPSVRMGIKERRHLKVHSLVARTFIGEPPTPAHQIRHLDGSRTNNVVSNLVWGTVAENAQDRSAHGRTHNRWTGTFHPAREVAS